MPLAGDQYRKSVHPQSGSAQIELAQQLFREYYAQCFWHSPEDLEIDEDQIGFVSRGLRTHGGRSGLMEATKLQAKCA